MGHDTKAKRLLFFPLQSGCRNGRRLRKEEPTIFFKTKKASEKDENKKKERK